MLRYLEMEPCSKNMLCMTAKNESFQNLYCSKIVGPTVSWYEFNVFIKPLTSTPSMLSRTLITHANTVLVFSHTFYLWCETRSKK